MKKRKDGRYAKQVTIGIKDGKPIKKTVYGTTIKEVEKKHRELMLQVDRGTIVKDNSMTLTELKNEWYNIKIKGKVKQNSELAYSSVLTTLDETIGCNQIKNITPYLIESVLNDLQFKQGHGCKADRFLYLTNTIFKYGIQREYIYKNPCIGLSVKHKAKQKRALTSEEKELIDNADLPLREQTLLYILRYTGMRRGEVYALSKNDIDRDNMCIQISKTVVDNNGDPYVQNSPKSEAGNRLVPIFLPLAKVLFHYIDSIDSDYLFLNQKGNLCAAQTMRNTLKLIIKSTGLGTDVTYHTFRHNFISESYMAGVNVKKLQQWVGHSDISTTLNIYTHLSNESLMDGEELNEYYKKSQTEVKNDIYRIV